MFLRGLFLVGMLVAPIKTNRVNVIDPVNDDTLDVCYVCFGPCEFFEETYMTEDILRQYGWTGPEEGVEFNMVAEYFRLVTSKVSEAITNMDSNFSVSFRGTYEHEAMIWLNSYTRKTSQDALSDASMVFSVSALQKAMHEQLGCDATFLTSPANDGVFIRSGAAGMALAGRVCSEKSSGIVSLNTDINKQANIVAHELGHLMLMYHDFESPPAGVVAMAANPDMADVVQNVIDNCHGSNDCGCTDPSGQCIMSHVSPSLTYSECSKAYYENFKVLDEEYQGFYELSCFLEDDDNAANADN